MPGAGWRDQLVLNGLYPSTGLYYVKTLEACANFVKRTVEWKAGAGYMGGTARRDGGQKILRAIDIQTGEIRWEAPQAAPANSWGGVLATAGDIVLFCDDGVIFSAADAQTGRRLWQWPAGVVSRSSPMTYTFDGQQYVAVIAGSNVVSFGLTPSIFVRSEAVQPMPTRLRTPVPYREP